MQYLPEPEHRKQSPKKLASYLLLPRPDGMFRASITLTGWAIANMLTGWQWWREGFVLAIVFDFLIYQARYQWNDIQGRMGDLLSPMATERGRLPQAKRALVISLTAIATRFCLALLVCLLPWPSKAWPTPVAYFGLGTMAVIALTIAYEQVRQYQRQTESCSRASFILVTVLITLGYPLRFAVGFFVTAPNLRLAGEAPFAGGALAFALVGTMSVTMAWILEASSYGNINTSQKTITTLNRKILRAKPHLYRNWLNAGLDGQLQDNSPLNGASLFMLKKVKAHVWRIWNFTYFLGSFTSVISLIAMKQQITAWPVLIAICIGTLVLFELLARVSGGGKAIAAASLLMLYFIWLTTGHQLTAQAGVAALVGLLWMFYYFTFYEMSYFYALHNTLYIRAAVETVRHYIKKRYLRTTNSLRSLELLHADK